MTRLSTSEDSAKRILAVFKHLDARFLRYRSFVGIFKERSWEANDIDPGLALAIEKGWVVKTPNGSYELTDSGFAER